MDSGTKDEMQPSLPPVSGAVLPGGREDWRVAAGPGF